MVVALTKEAMSLKSCLEGYGHKVVPCNGYRGSIDAVVYKGTPINTIGLTNSNFSNHSGVMLIDCTNRTAVQVNNYLKNRSYSSIF